ncbi:peptidase [Ktedonosporobacter rubrisoli]|uniref:Tricorn protease homolog n=1 Tax=Ktedonosporobacter rubrisoli TaxID=2509675 RepID=A0A4P6JK08_KTERU|nr:S41 family peptidase [Ktedonosporobacter rubrisoli]QBD75474.1 peptidase [Ktedonosporobacter rubrisoli]
MGTTGYLRFPTIYRDQLVFTAEDDLWRVSINGGRAERLTAGVAAATRAHFSPDGQQIAFTGNDEGPDEVYVMPADGGPSRRLTYHAGHAEVVGWQPDGAQILYASSDGLPSLRWRMLSGISPQGGEPVRLPYGIANAIAFGPNGAVVLGRNMREPAFWKRYRGGTVGYLWIDAQGTGEFKRLLDLNSNIATPCWVGNRIFFLSDHEGISNVYSCLPSGEDLRRHSSQETFYARNLATDGHRCVYHAGGDLFVLDPASNQETRLKVDLAGSQAQRARQFVSAGKFMDSYALHPKGQAVALTTRGKAFSLSNWEGAGVQHGQKDGPRYRLIDWLADGKRLVAVSDAGDEPRLIVFRADGSTPDRTLGQLDIGHVTALRAAPVGDLVLLVNHRNEVLLVDLAAETLRVLDRSDYGRLEDGELVHGIAWSPDGRWVAYEQAIQAQQSIIKLCRLESGETYQVTDAVRRDTKPAFDPAGRYLYFLSARDFDPVPDAMHFEFSFPKGVRPYLITLRKNLRSPFQPESSLLTSEDEVKKAEKAGGNPSEPERVEIDLDGITDRIVAFPVPEGRYGRVIGARNGAFFTSLPIEGIRTDEMLGYKPKSNGSLEWYDFEKRKQEHIADEIGDIRGNADGTMVLCYSHDRLRVLKAGEKPPEGSSSSAADKPGRESGWLDLERLKVSIRPGAEWRQMFGEAWRLQREQFWVADLAGVDWQGVYARYSPLVERLTSRGELSDLLWEMQGELGSSHAYEFGGEYRSHPEYHQGFLGVDWRFDADEGVYRIAHIVRGDPWNAKETSPLLAPGVDAKVGDAVLAINGQHLTAEQGPQQPLVNQAETEVQILLQPTNGPARSVTVRALASEFGARYRDWVEANRRLVHEKTHGRVGYVHIPDMWADGYAEFHRYYLAEYDHEGLIVDVRWNGGGAVSGLVLEKLARPRLGYAFQRWSTPDPYIYNSPRGKLVAITNENAGSDGDIFSHTFKLMGLGPLIGKRTWGGVIGISPYMPLADGTITTQPEFSFWFKDVGWGVENYGTDPTIDVDYTPQDYARGFDPQLERGIAEALRLIEEYPAATPTPEQHPYRGYPKK